jgi:RHS repeat-associated protein
MESDTYDGAGNPVKQVAGNGTRVTQYTLTPTGQVASSVTDPTGLARRTTFTYDLAGNVTSTTRSGNSSNVPWAAPTTGSTVSYEYDLSGNATKETANAGGATTAVTTSRYDQRGMMLAQTDPRGNVSGADPTTYTTTFSYDEAGSAVSIVGPAVSAEQAGGAPQTVHSTQTVGFDTFGDSVEQRDELGNVSHAGYDRLGQAVSQTGPSYLPPGSSTPITPTALTQYDGLGNVKQSTDPLGHVTRYTYDQLSRMTTRDVPASTDSQRAVSHYTYTRTGDVLSVTDPTGAQALTTYDDLDRQASVTQVERYPTANNYTTTYSYDDGGDVLSSTAPSGATTTMKYDTVGELTSSTDPSHVVSQYGYDFAGRQVRASDGMNRTSRTDYDALGHTASESDVSPAGATLRTVTYAYDAAGNLTGSTDPYHATTTYDYDAAGRMVRQVEPVSASHSITTTFGYDAAGNRTRYTDGRGNSTIYTVNSLGLPESVIVPATSAQSDASDRTWTMAYDADGQPATLTAPGGVVRQRHYDAAGNLTSETGSGGQAASASRTLGYDLADRVKSVSAPGGTNSYSYDDRGDLLSATGPSGNASFTYDADGNLTSRVDAAGTSRYSYTNGRMSTLTDGLTGTTQTLGYDPAGNVASVDYGAGRVRGYGYDDFGRLASDTVRNSTSAAVSSITYGYDLNDRGTQKTTTGTAGAAVNTYGYDQAGRMTSWTAGGTTTSYGWDDSGNRIQAGAKTASFDQRDRLLSDSDYTYSYTPRGTLATRSSSGYTEQYSFDAFDRMVGDNGQSYTYDGLDRAVTGGGASFSYDGMNTEPTSDGSQLFARGPADDLLAVAQGQAGQSSNSDLTLTDQHGDVVGDFSGSNTTLSSLNASTAYDPFGNVTASSGTSQSDLGYQGDWTDPTTGQVDMGARWYQPGTGTFDSTDPQTYTSGDSVLANPYVYGADDPVDNSDPNGEWPSFHCGWCHSVVHAVAHAASSAWNTVTHVASTVGNALYSAAMWAWSAARTAASFIARAAVAVYHAARTVVHYVAHAVSTAYHYVANAVSSGVSWAVQKAQQARQAAIAAAHRVTSAAKAAVSYAIQHNPLPAIVAAVKPLYSGLTKVVSAVAHLPAAVVAVARNVVNDAAKAAKVIYQNAVAAAGTVVHDVSVAAQKVSEFAQAALPMVAGIAAGVLTTAGCLAITGGAGSAACVVAGFAVGGAVSGALNCPPGASVAGCAVRGGAAGLVGGAVFVATGGMGGGLSAGIIAGGLSSAASSATQQYLDTGHVDAASVAQSGVEGAVFGGLGARLGGGATEGGIAADDASASAAPAMRGCNSFTEDTPVLMADGSTKPISQVHDGDRVLSTDPTTGRTSPEKVTDTILGQGTKHLVELTVAAAGVAGVAAAASASASASAGPVAAATGQRSPGVVTGPAGDGQRTGTLVATDNHPFWVANAHEWRIAADLRLGDLLRTSAGTYVQVTAVKKWTATDQRVRNLTVDTLHTFYVLAGSTPILVHNAGACYQWAKPNAPTHVLGPGQAWHPSQGTPVLGRQVDTEVVGSWPGHTYLNIPDWTLAKNDAYIQTIIDQRGTVYTASPLKSNFWNAGRSEPTVYAREVQQMLQAGYAWNGDYLVPPR